MTENQIAVPQNPSDNHHPSIILNPDGTYTRLIHFPNVPATPNHATTSSSTTVLSKDIPMNPKTQTWLRIFLPRQQTLDNSFITNKVPVIVYYHGGGFVFMSAASTMIHDFCSKMAAGLNVIIVSVEYRLAPEHRLPAAYDDAVEALHVIKNTQEVWLREFADLSNCFLMGSSAGGNIAYHAGGRVCDDDIGPLRIRGLILHQPFFGGSKRTQSELRMENDLVLPLHGTDLLWKLSLPIGADRDHEYCNPTVCGVTDYGDRIRALGLRVLMTGCYGDPLIDRQMEFTKTLERKSVRPAAHFGDGYHGIEVSEPSKAEALFLVLKNFIHSV